MDQISKVIVLTQVRSLKLLIALSLGILICITWPLWFGVSEFPRIPWFHALCSIPIWVDTIAIGIVWIGLLGLVFESADRKWPEAVFLMGLGSLLLLDQHRLQPWAWQMWLSVLSLFVLRRDVGLSMCRWVVISIYLFSALSKFDAEFLHSHGQLLLNGLCDAIGIESQFWTAQTKSRIAAVFPVGEAFTALLLMRPKWWRNGLMASIVMHGCLLLTLGPRGLNHEPGVLIWNVYFILQNFILFGPKTSLEASPRAAWYPSIPIAIVLAFPVLNVMNHYDHWPSWAVYCSRPAQVKTSIHESEIEKLPTSLQPFMTPQPLSEWQTVSLDGWSFAERHVPLYPQERYRLAVIMQVCIESHVREEALHVDVRSTPNRSTGQRSSHSYYGMLKVSDRLAEFYVNTQAR